MTETSDSGRGPERGSPAAATGAPDFLSGDAGDVTTRSRVLRRAAGEFAYDALDLLAATRPRVDRIARRQAPQRVLVLSIYRAGSLLADALPALVSERHEVELALGATGDPEPALATFTRVAGLTGGKFQNLDRVLAASPDPARSSPDPARSSPDPARSSPDPARFDWTLVIDDDLRLPPRFLDRFVGLACSFALDLAQPAQTLRSHSAWKVTRRQPASLARETRFVEIGPVTAFSRRAATELLPFPDLRFGWGLDLHWAAVAAERGWRLGVVDAVPVDHRHATVAAAYDSDDAVAEAADFLRDRPYLPAAEANRTLRTHRRLPSAAG